MRLIAAVVSLTLFAPRPLFACAVCGLIGSEENGMAYLLMTLVMSGLPLLLIGGVVTWLYRNVAQADGQTIITSSARR